MTFQYRPFCPEDASDIKEVAQSSWLYTYGHIFDKEYILKRTSRSYNPELIRKLEDPINKGLTEMIVCEHNNKVIGFAQVGFYRYYEGVKIDKIELSRIYIQPQFIGKEGIGKELLQLVEKWVLDKGYNRYSVFVHKENPIGIRFYEKNGFKRISEFDENDELFYEKLIS